MTFVTLPIISFKAELSIQTKQGINQTINKRKAK